MNIKSPHPCESCGKICRGQHCRQCSNKINPPARGRIVSQETRNKIATSLRGKSPWNKGTSKRVRLTQEEKAKKCSERMRANNPVNKPGVREKIRSTLLCTYKNNPAVLENRKPSGINQFANRMTSIERPIADTLNQLGIGFIHNYRIGRYFADFLILENVVFECDGEYWHRDSEKDRRKDQYLYDKGFYVFRFNGKRILDDPRACVIMAIEILNDLGHKGAAGFQCTELPFDY